MLHNSFSETTDVQICKRGGGEWWVDIFEPCKRKSLAAGGKLRQLAPSWMHPKVIFAALAKFPDCEALVKFPDCEGGQDTWSVARMLLVSAARSSQSQFKVEARLGKGQGKVKARPEWLFCGTAGTGGTRQVRQWETGLDQTACFVMPWWLFH